MKGRQTSTRWLGLALACGTLAFEAQGAETLSFNRLASWPGYEMGSVVRLYPTGSVVWLGMDCSSIGSLLALDISNPTSSVALSSTPIRGGRSWAFDNGFAYALGTPSSASSSLVEMEIYDLADARHPVLRGGMIITPGWSANMAAYQGYLWVFSAQGVETYDVRNPSAPQRAGGLLWESSQQQSRVVRIGDFGVMLTTDPRVDKEYALRVFDLSKPAQPTETDVMPYNIGNISSGLSVLTSLDDYVYYKTGSPTAGDYQAYLHAVRISNTGTIEPTAVNLRLTGGGHQICAVGDYLYLGGEDYSPLTHWIRLLNVTDRLAPKLLSSPVIPVPTSIRNLVSSEGRVLISLGGRASGLFALNATNPAQPSILGTVWRTWTRLNGLVSGSDEPIWHVRDEGTSRIRLHRVAGLLQGTPAPYREWDLPLVPGQSSPRDVGHVLLRSNYCYVLSVGVVSYPSSACWLDVYDLSGSGTPVHKLNSQIYQQNGGGATDGLYHTIKMDGNELYLGYWPGVLDIHSLTNPASPQLLSTVSVDLPGDLEIHNGYAYLFSAGSIKRLEVVDVRDPANPSAMSICREYTGVWYGKMAVDGNLLYVQYVKANAIVLDVFDLADPLNPTRLSSTLVTPTESGFQDIAIRKPYAFVAGAKLVVVDISNPAQPKILGSYIPFPQFPSYTGGGISQVQAWGNHIVVQDGTSGIVVLDVAQVLSRLTLQPWWAGTLRLSWEGAPGISLQRSTSLPSQWEPVANTDGRSEAIVSLGSPQAFFRLVRP